MAANVRLARFQSRKSAGDTANRGSSRSEDHSTANRSESRYGNGCRRTPLTNANAAVVTVMPVVIATTIAAATAGLRRNCTQACLISRSMRRPLGRAFYAVALADGVIVVQKEWPCGW